MLAADTARLPPALFVAHQPVTHKVEKSAGGAGGGPGSGAQGPGARLGAPGTQREAEGAGAGGGLVYTLRSKGCGPSGHCSLKWTLTTMGGQEVSSGQQEPPRGAGRGVGAEPLRAHRVAPLWSLVPSAHPAYAPEQLRGGSTRMCCHTGALQGAGGCHSVKYTAGRCQVAGSGWWSLGVSRALGGGRPPSEGTVTLPRGLWLLPPPGLQEGQLLGLFLLVPGLVLQPTGQLGVSCVLSLGPGAPRALQSSGGLTCS